MNEETIIKVLVQEAVFIRILLVIALIGWITTLVMLIKNKS